MVLRDFRCVSARAAYRGVKNVDLHPLFLLWREEGFLYYARGTICVDVYALYIFFSAENI